MPLLRPLFRKPRQEQARPENCLNCGKPVREEHAFCGYCGQENDASPVSFAALLGEAWEEFVKIDGKLLRTLSLLLFRPGFLSHEYVIGRRAAYLSPFKMYIGVSALFFLVFTLLIPFDRIGELDSQAQQVKSAIKQAKEIKDKNPTKPPRTVIYEVGGKTSSDPADAWKDLRSTQMSILGNHFVLGSLPSTVSTYRDQQEALPYSQRDQAVVHFLKERLIRLRNDPGDSLKSLLSSGLPLLMLVQLPLFAIWMRLIYVRHKRLYVEHLVFLLHTHTFFFLVFGVVLVVDMAAQSIGRTVSWFSSGPGLFLGLTALITTYNLLALRRFYDQGWGKVLIKAWLLWNGYVILILFSLGLAAMGAVLSTLLAPG